MDNRGYAAVRSGEDQSWYKRLCGLDGTIQEGTFITSMIFQAVTLVVSIVALVQGNMPSVLRTIVWLELIVQAVELTWYSYIAVMYLSKGGVPISYRYFDWMITTPIMMTSILLFVLWDADKDCDNVLGPGSRVAALVIIIVMDLLMLLVGYVYEVKDGMAWTASMRSFFDMLLCNMRENVGLYLGFIPFLGIFTPLFIIVGQEKTHTGWGTASVVLTFVAWLLYGVVAILGSEQLVTCGLLWDEEARNTAYNVLDIFSKNAVGLIVSSVAIGNDFNTSMPVNCTTF
jgi:hypothetical protein